MRNKDRFERRNREEKISLMFDLINSFRIVRNPLETALFLQDLLTANEIRNLSVRLRIAKLLMSGKNYRDIKSEVHSSFATISKVSTWLDVGGEGFKNVIKRLPLKWQIPKDIPRGPIEFHLPQTILALTQYTVAMKQNKNLKKFIRAVKNKESISRGIRKEFDEYYKNMAVERRSFLRKAEFSRKLKKVS